MTSPRYIAFEGIDGCGKSTQVDALCDYFNVIGLKHIKTREPGNPELGLNVRDLLLSDKPLEDSTIELLFQADRSEQTAWVREKLKDGYTVVSDRSYLSGVAYAMAKGFNLKQLGSLLDFSISVAPTDVVYLDRSVADSYGSLDKNNLTREEKRGQDFMFSVKNNFDYLFSTPSRFYGDAYEKLGLNNININRIACIEGKGVGDVSISVRQALGYGS